MIWPCHSDKSLQTLSRHRYHLEPINAEQTKTAACHCAESATLENCGIRKQSCKAGQQPAPRFEPLATKDHSFQFDSQMWLCIDLLRPSSGHWKILMILYRHLFWGLGCQQEVAPKRPRIGQQLHCYMQQRALRNWTTFLFEYQQGL